jgi:hypothetical protein
MSDFFTANAHELWHKRNNKVAPDYASKVENAHTNEVGINEEELVEDLLVHHSVAVSKEYVAVHKGDECVASKKDAAAVTDKSCAHLVNALGNPDNLPLSENDLKRFLIARKNNLPKATAMVQDYLKWLVNPIKGMEHTTPASILDIRETPAEIEKWKTHFPFAYSGHDRDGCPIYWEKAGITIANYSKAKAAGISEDHLVWHHIMKEQHMVEVGMKYASAVFQKDVSQQLAVCDMTGIKLGLDTTTLAYFIRATAIDQNFYPGRLKKFIIFNVPWFFKSIWAAVRPFLGPSTQSKFILLREGEDFLSVLEKYIDPSQIPVELGGANKDFEYDSDVRHLDSKEHCLRAVAGVGGRHSKSTM